jgi:O-antigen/teichoic acid export membrane protein
MKFTGGTRETLILFATQMWNVAAGLGTQSVLAWTLAPVGRGEYAVCMLFGATFGVFFTLGIDRAAQYFMMTRQQSLSQAGSVAILAALGGSAVAIALGSVLIESPIAFFHKADAGAFAIGLVLIPLTVLVSALQLLLAGLRRFAWLAFATLAQCSCALALIVVLVGVLGLGVHGALAAQASSSLLVVALMFRELRVSCRFVPVVPRWAQIRPILAYGCRYYLARIGTLIDSGLGMFIVAMFATREEIGLFAAASALVLKVFVFADSMEAALLPRVADDPAGRTELVARCVRLSGLFTAAAVACIVIAGVPLVTILLSPKFLAAVPLIWILAPGVVLYGGSQILMAFFRGTGRPGTCSVVIWVGLIVNLIALLVLYPLIGLPGAACATTLSYASRVVVLFIRYRQATGQRARDVLRFRRSDVDVILQMIRGVYGKLFPAFNA